MPDPTVNPALRGPWEALLIGNDTQLISLDEAGPYLWIEIRVARGSALPISGILSGPYDEADVLYLRDGFANQADLAMRWEQAQAIAKMMNLAADTPPWHLVEFREKDFTIQHPLGCRLDGQALFACPFNTVLRNLAGPPEVMGIHRCEIGADGTLQVYADAPAGGAE